MYAKNLENLHSFVFIEILMVNICQGYPNGAKMRKGFQKNDISRAYALL